MALEPASDHADYDQAVKKVQQTVSKAHYEHHDRLPMWVVFGPGTSDHPGLHVARMWLMRPDEQRTNLLIRAASLEEIHRLLPPGLTVIPRFEGDDPNIVETWL